MLRPQDKERFTESRKREGRTQRDDPPVGRRKPSQAVALDWVLRNAGWVRSGLADAEIKQCDGPKRWERPLALGGNPTSLENLWLQRWLGPWNARLKDRLERKLQVLVCEGKVRLDVARNAIRKGWKAAYAKYVDGVGAPREMEPDDDDEPVE